MTAIFRDEPSLRTALAELADAGLEPGQFNVHREAESLEDDSPGNDETLMAQNRAGFAMLGGFLFLLAGTLLAWLAGWLHRKQPVTFLIPLGFLLLGRFVGGRVGKFFRLGYRTTEDLQREAGDKLVLHVEPSSLEEHRLTIKILKRNGAVGEGKPLL